MKTRGSAVKRPNAVVVGRRVFGVFVGVLLWVGLVPGVGLAASGPVLAGSISDAVTLPGTSAVAISGHYAYTTGYYAGELTAVDVSNPSSPVIAGSSASRASVVAATNVAISGGFAYVVSKNRNGPCMPGPAPNSCQSGSNDDGSGNSLTIFDIATNPAQPTYVGSVTDTTALFGSYGVAVSGHYVYVAAQGCLSGQPCPNAAVGNSFVVIDVSNPTTPTIVATIHNTTSGQWSGALSHADSVTVSGNYAYVTAFYGNRLTVINISTPTAPSIVASLQDSANPNRLVVPNDVAVSGHFAFVVDQTSPSGRVTAVDITDPTHPVIASSVAAPVLSGAYRIRVLGDFAYVSASSAAAVGVIDISDPSNIRLAASITDSAHLNKTIGLDIDPAGFVVAASLYLSTESQPLYPPYALQTGGPTLHGTVSTITLDPAPITVSITASTEPANPTSQTTASFGFSVNDAVAAVQCQLDAGAFTPCTTSTTQQYSSLGPGSHTFNVQATDAAGNTSTASYTWTVNTGSSQAPHNSTLPTVSGTPTEGSQLTATNGTWSGSPAPTFTYQWERCDQSGQGCTPVSSATSNPAPYTLTAADVGSTIEVLVTADNGVGSAVMASSQPTGVVQATAATKPQNTSPPVVSGTAKQGAALTASSGSWSGSPAPAFAYQWMRCDQNAQNCIKIATGSGYTLTATDVGSTIEVVVTATNTAGSTSATSTPTGRVAGPPAAKTAPRIAGTAHQKSQLTGTNGSWSGYPAPSFAYRWQRCDSNGAHCSTIAGQTTTRHTVTASDVGSTLRFAVVGSNASGSVTAVSAATGVVSANQGAVQANARNVSLAGLTDGRARLRLTLLATRSGALLDRVVVGLPKGLSLSASRQNLAKGVTVEDRHGKHLRFSDSLSHGSLVVRMKSPAAGLQILLGRPAIRVSRNLAGSVSRKKTEMLGVTLAVAATGVPTSHLRVMLRAA